MIRKSTATGSLILVALLVLGAFVAGSASAVSQFLWTGPLPGLLLVLSDNTQVFTAAAGLEIECQHFGGHGVLSNGKAMSAKEVTITGTYTKCLAGGIAAATVSPAEFLVNADGSIAVVGKPIVVTIPAIECSLKINNDGANSNLKTIKYLNLSQDVLAHVEITKITSLGSTPGQPCGEPGVEKTEGTYRGLLLIFAHKGTLRWDP